MLAYGELVCKVVEEEGDVGAALGVWDLGDVEGDPGEFECGGGACGEVGTVGGTYLGEGPAVPPELLYVVKS